MTINSSGSLYPDKSILDHQLKPQGAAQEVNSSGAKIEVAGNVYEDLTRLGKLVVNGDNVYESNGYKQLNPDNTQAKASHVFNTLESKLNSTHLALQAASLMEQNLGGEVLKQVAKTKGITDENAVTSTHALTAKKNANILTSNGKTFKLVHEELVQKTDFSDLDKKTFFKVKTVVQGPLTALETSNSQQMTVEAAYTKEHQTMEGALHDDYTGTRVGGLFNRESYLKGLL